MPSVDKTLTQARGPLDLLPARLAEEFRSRRAILHGAVTETEARNSLARETDGCRGNRWCHTGGVPSGRRPWAVGPPTLQGFGDLGHPDNPGCTWKGWRAASPPPLPVTTRACSP